MRANRSLVYVSIVGAASSGSSWLVIPSLAPLSAALLVFFLASSVYLLLYALKLNKEIVVICDQVCLEVVSGALQTGDDVRARSHSLFEDYRNRHTIVGPLVDVVVSRVISSPPGRGPGKT